MQVPPAYFYFCSNSFLSLVKIWKKHKFNAIYNGLLDYVKGFQGINNRGIQLRPCGVDAKVISLRSWIFAGSFEESGRFSLSKKLRMALDHADYTQNTMPCQKRGQKRSKQ